MIKTFRRHPKRANLSGLSPAFSSCIIYTLLVEIQRNFEIPLVDFCETSHNRRRGPKVAHFQRKCRQRQKFDLELKPLWCHFHVIFIPIIQKIISQVYVYYICYNVFTIKITLVKYKRFKDGRCTSKNIGSSYLKCQMYLSLCCLFAMTRDRSQPGRMRENGDPFVGVFHSL